MKKDVCLHFGKRDFFSGRMFYICPGKTGAMKRIVLVIFLLGIIVWGWSTVREDSTLAEGTEKTQPMPASEARQDVDRLIGVLREANRFAEVCAIPSNSVPSNLVRRYRPAGFLFDHLSVCVKTGLYRNFNLTLKIFLELSQAYAAHLKTMGYYVYVLRRIII
jgi:hypothetical protein